MPTIQIVDTIHRIDREEWDALVGENVFESYGWLKTLEQTLIGDYNPRYFLLREEGRLIATAACHIAHPSNKIYNSDDTLLGRLKRYASKMGISFLPALIGSPRGAYGIHLSVGEGLDSKKAESAEKDLIEAIENFASEHRLPVLFPNVMDHEVSLIRYLTERGYSKAVTFPLNYLDVEWSSFNDYLANRKRISRGGANMIRREINKNRNEGVVIQPLENVDGFQKRLFELANQNYMYYNGRPFPYRQEYFKTLKENLGSHAVIYAAAKQNRLVGVCVLLRRKKTYYIPVVGVDHESTGNDFTYFNLVFYRPIQEAISDRIERIYYGQAFYSVKTRRGCKISNTYTLYKPHRKVSQLAVKPWFWILSIWYRRKTIMEIKQVS